MSAQNSFIIRSRKTYSMFWTHFISLHSPLHIQNIGPRLYNVIFLMITVFCDVTPCNLVKQPASSVLSFAYEAYLSETSMPVYQTARYHIPRQINLNINLQESLKSHTSLYVLGLLNFLLMFISSSLLLLLFLVHSFSYFLSFSI
jgi:hypothetical protein